MKALILAAGNGTRLRPLTNDLPKCLLPIQGVPMLQLWLEHCERHGLNEIVVNVHAHAGAIRRFVDQYLGPVSVDVFEEHELLGSAGTLYALREHYRPDPLFWILYGDVLTNVDLSKLLEFHLRQKQIATLGLYEVKNPRSCGIVMMDDHHIIRDFEEKPAEPKGNLAFAGVMVGNSKLLDMVTATDHDIGSDLLSKLLGQMAGYKISEYLLDIGTMENYQRAQIEWVNPNIITRSAQVPLVVAPC